MPKTTLENLETLYEGQGFRRGLEDFPTTRTIVEPWINEVQPITERFNITVEMPRDIAVSFEGQQVSQEHTIFTRVLIEAVLTEEYQVILGGDDRHSKVFGLLYGLDVNNPVCKTYTGFERSACTNLCVFSPQSIIVKSFNDPDFKSIYAAPRTFLERIEQDRIMLERAYEFLNSRRYQADELETVIGRLAMKIAQKQGLTTAFNNMVSMITTNRRIVGGVENLYYSEDGSYTPYQLYNALTATVSDRSSHVSRPNRILEIYKLFQNEENPIV